MNLRLHIERLIVDHAWFDRARATDLGTTIETRLAELLSTDQPLEAIGSGSMAQLTCPELADSLTPAGAALGIRVAEALHAGLSAAHRGDDAGGRDTR